MLRVVTQVSNPPPGQPPASPADPAASPIFLAAPGPALVPALSLVLSTATRLATDREVGDFIRISAERNIDLSTLTAIEDAGRIMWALLPIDTPGGTLQLLSPNYLFDVAQVAPAGRLIDTLCLQYARRGGKLAQVLIDPASAAVRTLYQSLAFQEMAELRYLQSPIRRPRIDPVLPPDYHFETYTPATHALFAQAIRESYAQSLDCPTLNGLRDIEDVIHGHQAAGVSGGGFDASLWRVLIHRPSTGPETPCGVLLLARTDPAEAMELVYIGLAPSARRKGFGKLLVQQALAAAHADHRTRLTLAVDSRNQPALSLYYSQGFQNIGVKVALIRNLCSPKQFTP
jgi:ribosomal protein S18 acetylase RimI-like enzyme